MAALLEDGTGRTVEQVARLELEKRRNGVSPTPPPMTKQKRKKAVPSIPKAPRQTCPLCAANLIGQAKELCEAGFYIAAVATIRCELEARLTTVVVQVSHGRYETVKTGNIGHMTAYLKMVAFLGPKECDRIRKVGKRAGRMLHKYENCTCTRARWLIAEVESLSDALMQRIDTYIVVNPKGLRRLQLKSGKVLEELVPEEDAEKSVEFYNSMNPKDKLQSVEY